MMPSLRDGVDQVFPLGVGETLSISADSESPDAAAKVFDALFSNPARSASILEAIDFETWLVPVNWSLDNFADTTDPRLVQFIVDMAAKSGEGKIGYTTWTFFPPKTRNYLFETLESVLVGGSDIDTFIAGIQPLLDGEMDLVPPLPTPVQ
jgi:raffinose/stachyose/melibiose transport system substrate-binding protein